MCAYNAYPQVSDNEAARESAKHLLLPHVFIPLLPRLTSKILPTDRRGFDPAMSARWNATDKNRMREKTSFSNSNDEISRVVNVVRLLLSIMFGPKSRYL